MDGASSILIITNIISISSSFSSYWSHQGGFLYNCSFGKIVWKLGFRVFVISFFVCGIDDRNMILAIFCTIVNKLWWYILYMYYICYVLWCVVVCCCCMDVMRICEKTMLLLFIIVKTCWIYELCCFS